MTHKTPVINVLIIDDEAPARLKLQRLVEQDNRFSVLALAKNGLEALDKIAELQPDLLLLDIQMPGMTGFDVLRLMDTASPAIIFTTAFDEYAVKAFEVSAIDYLLKPITESRLTQALDKVANACHSAVLQTNWDKKVDDVLNKLKHKEYVKRLAVRHLKRVHLLSVSDISHIVSEHRLIHVYAKNGDKFWTNENLSQLAARLDPNHFMRVHRSTIINLSSKFEIETIDSGRLKLHFSNEQILFVSREHSHKLKQSLGL